MNDIKNIVIAIICMESSECREIGTKSDSIKRFQTEAQNILKIRKL